jgi:glycosyltransferase involved in cell wall biosynthesis
MADFPRISFGMIVFNGEPFVVYNLRALYPFAHEIIVVEGACEASSSLATKDGHSTDGTLETLHRFKNEEDKDNKVQVIVRDRFWKEKDEQSRTYAERATGDYIWQIDVDEFYQPEDMSKIIEMLRKDHSISGCSIKQITFWGGFDYLTDGFYLRSGADIYRRIFKWGKGYSFISHRPPTVYDAEKRDLTTANWIEGEQLARNGILLYHYSLLFPKQVREKCEYYSQARWADRPLAQKWAEDVESKKSVSCA